MRPPLPDELVEEVFLRFPPENPAGLVRAALVCRRWCRLVSDAGFRRRFREFHRRPPMLGMFINLYDVGVARFVPTTAFCYPRTDFGALDVLDARHGRVLLCRGEGSVLMVWDPITGEERDLHLPQPQSDVSWTAAILCSDAAGTCNHLDCHRRPFLVVFVCSQGEEIFVYTYSSDADAWSEPVCAQRRDYRATSWMGSALVGNTLYFGSMMNSTALKYNLEFCQILWLQLPSLYQNSQLTAMEDGGLGVATNYGSKLYLWLRKDTHGVDAIWERRVIELTTLLPVDVALTTNYVIGSADGLDIFLLKVGDVVYTIDLKTYKARKVYDGTTISAVPYMSFYTPAFGGTCTGEVPSASCSSS